MIWIVEFDCGKMGNGGGWWWR